MSANLPASNRLEPVIFFGPAAAAISALIILTKLVKKRVVSTFSPAETLALGEDLSKNLVVPHCYVFTLSGDLGSGKTLMTKGIAKGLGVDDWYYVNSPTFTLVNEYSARLPLYHFDLYRLNDLDDLWEIGFIEYLSNPGVVVIEWPEKIGTFSWETLLTVVEFTVISDQQRLITVSQNYD